MGCVDWNLNPIIGWTDEEGHIPHGMCGLKCDHPQHDCINCRVTSRMGCVDWNVLFLVGQFLYSGHIPHGMCGLKFRLAYGYRLTKRSHPAWDVWIEMKMVILFMRLNLVTSRMGCVDWNGSSFGALSLPIGHIPHGMCGLKYWPPN